MVVQAGAADTAVAVVPVRNLRLANIKLIERKYLLEITKQQDSIIKLNNEQIKLTNIQLIKYKDAFEAEQRITEYYHKRYNKTKRQKKVLGYTSIGTFIVGLISGIIISK